MKNVWLALLCGPLVAMTCDLSAYRTQQGLKAEMSGGTLVWTWDGAKGGQLRASFDIRNGSPVVLELAAKQSGGWVKLGSELTPEFHITTGKRRISNQQMSPLKEIGKTDEATIEREKWKVFWDAPLSIPGLAGTNPDLPRKAEEVRREYAKFTSAKCSVKTDGARLEVTFDGASTALFQGSVMYTAYRGTNLLRQELIAKTEAPSVAYKYNAGLKGFRIEPSSRVVWRDTSRSWQKYEFGGAVNDDPVALRARHRLAMIEAGGGTLAAFPPPHKFFFAREVEMNLGYVYYRKDSNDAFAFGVRQAEREEMYRPYGFTDEQWNKRVTQSRRFALGNFALYNAPPGTLQRMPVYFYLSASSPADTEKAVLAFTHEDTYKPLAGHQVAISHFHTHFHEMLSDAGTIDAQPNWLTTFRAMGVNIAMMSDFHSDGHPKDAGPLRLKEQKTYFDGCRRHSDKDFLIMPGEEPDAYFGGHYTMIFPKPVFWTHVRKEGQSFQERGVYHVGSAAEELDMLKREGGLAWQAHPRTKGSSGYPETIRETPYFRSDRYLGASFQSLPVDLSEKRLCEERCFGTLDDMNNWGAPKYMFAEGDTYAKNPEDDTYSHLLVNYVKLAKVPRFDEDWSPILKALREGQFFVTSGEVLIRDFSVKAGVVAADVEWTFPLEFVEVVWSDGGKVDRKVVAATAMAPFGSHRFEIPFEAKGKKWVRFAAWDSAGNGAFAQPVHLQ